MYNIRERSWEWLMLFLKDERETERSNGEWKKFDVLVREMYFRKTAKPNSFSMAFWSINILEPHNFSVGFASALTISHSLFGCLSFFVLLLSYCSLRLISFFCRVEFSMHFENKQWESRFVCCRPTDHWQQWKSNEKLVHLLSLWKSISGKSC